MIIVKKKIKMKERRNNTQTNLNNKYLNEVEKIENRNIEQKLRRILNSQIMRSH